MLRIDAHQHFWRLDRGDYGWLTAREYPTLFRDFLPGDLAPQLKRSGIDRTVVVQAAPSDAETAFLLDLAQNNAFIGGVVGWTDLEAPDAVAKIEALARHPRFLGLRPMLQDLDDDAWLLRASIAPALAAMQRTQLTFDALVMPRHLPVLLRFLERNPELDVVVDHGAKPPIDAGEIDAWAAQIRAIARHTRAFCKVSGLATQAVPGWGADTLKPYVAVLLEAFGPGRLMWGSDWPVLHQAYIATPGIVPYESWHQIATSLLRGVRGDQHDQIFGGTAAAFYGIS